MRASFKAGKLEFIAAVDEKLALAAFVGCIAAVGFALAGTIAWTQVTKLKLYPIADVVAAPANVDSRYEFRPISEINTLQAGKKPVAFVGYEVKLIDACAHPADLLRMFGKFSAKLVVPEQGQKEYTIADAELRADICNKVQKNWSKYEGVGVAFDSPLPFFEKEPVKRVYVDKNFDIKKIEML
jgi:hypothetical protein